MSFKYDMTRNDLKKILLKRNNKTNYIYCIFFFIIIINLTSNYIKYQYWLIIFYIIYTIIFYLILKLINLFFTNISLIINDRKVGMYGTYYTELNKDGVIEKVKSRQITYKWENVKRFIKRENHVILIFNDKKNALIFERSLLKNDKLYDRVVNYIEKRLLK